MPDPAQTPEIQKLLRELFKDVAGQTGSADFDLPAGFGSGSGSAGFGGLPASFGDPSLGNIDRSFTAQQALGFGQSALDLQSNGLGQTGSPIALAAGLAPLVKGLATGDTEGQDKTAAVKALMSYYFPVMALAEFGVDTFGLNNANNNLISTIRQQRENTVNDARTDVVVDAFSTVSGKKTGDFSDTERGNIDAFAKLLNTKFPDLTPSQVRAAATRYFNNPRNATTTDSKNTLKETDLKSVVKPGEDVIVRSRGDQSINPRTGLPFGEGGTAPNYFTSSTSQLDSDKAQILKNAGISTKDSSGFHQGNALKILNKIQPEAAATGTGSQTNPLFLQAISKLFSGADEDSKTRSVLSQAFGSNPDFNFLNQG